MSDLEIFGLTLSIFYAAIYLVFRGRIFLRDIVARLTGADFWGGNFIKNHWHFYVPLFALWIGIILLSNWKG